MRKTKTEALKTRQQLLDAALEVFCREGVTRASLQQIAAQAGVTRGALYWHFKNKEDLFEALFEQKYSHFNQKLNETALHQSDNVLAYLRQSLLELFHQLEHDPSQQKFCQIMHLKCERTTTNQTITEAAMRYHRTSRNQILTALELCRRQGTLPDAINTELAAIYLESTLIGLIYIWIDEPERFKLHTVIEPVLDSAIHALTSGQFNRVG